MKLRLSITSIATVLAIALGAGAVASGASAPAPSRESWADTLHGWRVTGRQNMLGGFSAIQATDDGGRTWHTILRQPRYGITEIERTTATDGVAFVPRPRKSVLVTTDSGRHWKAITIEPRGFPVEASGRDLFWFSQRGPIRKFYRMRNALLGQTKTTAVASLPENWIFEGIRAVPGGAAAVADAYLGADTKLTFLVYRYGKVQTFTIAQPKRQPICPGSLHTLSIDWPVVAIVADEVATNPGPLGACRLWVGTVAFLSTDGGATWTESASQ
jgi:hypothetical protein